MRGRAKMARSDFCCDPCNKKNPTSGCLPSSWGFEKKLVHWYCKPKFHLTSLADVPILVFMRYTGTCLTTATRRCRKNFSQMGTQFSFFEKLRCHWLKCLRQRQIAVVRQGPGLAEQPTSIYLYLKDWICYCDLKAEHLSLHVLLSTDSCRVRTVPSNERRRYICSVGAGICWYNIFSHWLKSLSCHLTS